MRTLASPDAWLASVGVAMALVACAKPPAAAPALGPASSAAQPETPIDAAPRLHRVRCDGEPRPGSVPPPDPPSAGDDVVLKVDIQSMVPIPSPPPRAFFPWASRARTRADACGRVSDPSDHGRWKLSGDVATTGRFEGFTVEAVPASAAAVPPVLDCLARIACDLDVSPATTGHAELVFDLTTARVSNALFKRRRLVASVAPIPATRHLSQKHAAQLTTEAAEAVARCGAGELSPIGRARFEVTRLFVTWRSTPWSQKDAPLPTTVQQVLVPDVKVIEVDGVSSARAQKCFLGWASAFHWQKIIGDRPVRVTVSWNEEDLPDPR